MHAIASHAEQSLKRNNCELKMVSFILSVVIIYHYYILYILRLFNSLSRSVLRAPVVIFYDNPLAIKWQTHTRVTVVVVDC